MRKYYVDACIWLDYYENRSDRFRPLGEWALQFLNRAIRKNIIILYSRIVVRELMKQYDEKEIVKIFEIIFSKDLLQEVEVTEKQTKYAMKICKERNVAFGDALHAILARDNKAIVITRDRHFLELQDIAESKKPEELI